MHNGRKKLSFDELSKINGIAFSNNMKDSSDAKIKLDALKNSQSSALS